MEIIGFRPTITPVFEVSDSDVIVILDTNIILDVIERRDCDVVKFVNKGLLELSKKNIITVGTTLYNISEVLDKELELRFQLELLKKRLTPDEIIRTARNRRQLSREINRMNDEMRRQFFNDINKKLKRFLNKLTIFALEDVTERDYEILEKLILEGHLQSQDALIVLTTYKIGEYSSSSSLITKDSQLVDSPVVNGYIYVYNPKMVKRNPDGTVIDHRKALLDSIAGIRNDSMALKTIEKIKKKLGVE